MRLRKASGHLQRQQCRNQKPQTEETRRGKVLLAHRQRINFGGQHRKVTREHLWYTEVRDRQNEGDHERVGEPRSRVHQRHGGKASPGTGTEASCCRQKFDVQGCQIEPQLHHRMRQRKNKSRQKNTQGTVKVQIEKQAVAAYQIDESYGRHDGGRKQGSQKKHFERTSTERARHRNGIGHRKAQHSRRQSHGSTHGNGVADSAKVIGRQKRCRSRAFVRDKNRELGKRPEKPRSQECRKPSEKQLGKRLGFRADDRHCAPHVRQALSGNSTAMSECSANTDRSVLMRSASAVMVV